VANDGHDGTGPLTRDRRHVLFRKHRDLRAIVKTVGYWYVGSMAIQPSPDTKSQKRRRSQRLKARVTIEVRAQTADKQSATEKTEALIINAHGGLILLSMKVVPDQLVTVVNLKTGDELLSRVTSLGPSFMGKTEVGVEFIKPSPQFWDVSPVSSH
jgi:hypothetical protein